MLYAIVDIETNGSVHQGGGIMELAIVVSDGENVLDSFETLINPQGPIPPFVQNLTGIRPHMVAHAPRFEEIADQVYERLKDKIFVAHNVSFDFPFVREMLTRCGYDLNVPRVCTVRLGQKIVPGRKSYSLGKFCAELGIELENSHRAGGDARATASLLHWLKARDQGRHLEEMISRSTAPPCEPWTLSAEQRSEIPEIRGVFHFLNRENQVIYVGSSSNMRQRVDRFFNPDLASETQENIARYVEKVHLVPTATRLMLRIQEAADIMEHRPVFNRSRGRLSPLWGLVHYQDREGFMRLGIQKIRSAVSPLYTFHSQNQAETMLKHLGREFGLCGKYCSSRHGSCREGRACREPHCPDRGTAEAYNQRVGKAIRWIQAEPPSFAYFDQGRVHGERSCLLVKEGIFRGMGYLSADNRSWSMEELERKIVPLPHTDYIRGLIMEQARLYPDRCLVFI